jgi:glycosyltransferase involved in cell wall biosynthesis
VIAAYNSERWITESVGAVLAQTRPAHEVIVVNDGSTDATAELLAGFGDRIRVIERENGGCPAAFNSAFAAAGGDYVALCGADDVWRPRKLEWQAEALAANPGVAIACGHARVFGAESGEHPRLPASGVLPPNALRRALYEGNNVCAPTAVIRRDVFESLGPFVERVHTHRGWERFNADDYEYWLRALSAGAAFYYDPRPLVDYRRHDDNLTADYLHMRRSTYIVHRRFASEVERRLANEALGEDLFMIGRHSVDAGRPAAARRSFRASLRHRPRVAALVWIAVLSLPSRLRELAGTTAVRLKRRIAPSRQFATRWQG